MKPYQFAVLRYTHDLFGGEFVNVGLVLWSPEQNRLLYYVTEKYQRLKRFFDGFEGMVYRETTRQLVGRLRDVSRDLGGEGHPVLHDAPPSRLTEILATILPEGSCCFSWSEVAGGISPAPERRFDSLVRDLIERHTTEGARQRQDNEDIWRRIEQKLSEHGLSGRVRYQVSLQGGNYEYVFRTGWDNDRPQMAEPITLDFVEPTEVVDTAARWHGRLDLLAKENEFELTGVVAPPGLSECQKSYERAVAILRESPRMRRVVTVEDLDSLARQIRQDLDTHSRS